MQNFDFWDILQIFLKYIIYKRIIRIILGLNFSHYVNKTTYFDCYCYGLITTYLNVIEPKLQEMLCSVPWMDLLF